ncbi:MAG TPA: hypothetical protein VIX84_02130, partial [Acidimicrobiales bacterium]
MLIALTGAFVLSLAGPLPAQQYPATLYQGMRWRMIGPFRGGRTRAATGVPNQPNVFYMGQVNGGVWKSDDYGRTWNPIFEDQGTQSIGAIAVAPSDPSTIYVATGEGLQRPDLSVGDGIYRSTDAGKTWAHLGLRDGQQIPALAIDPRDPNRLFAAVLGHPYGANEERGLFRSTDGGQTWQKVLYRDENTGASDVEIDPSNPDVVYACLWRARQGPWEDGNEYGGAGGGIFKSTDAGTTWNRLAGGLPEDLMQAYVGIASSNTRRLYASIATTHGQHIYRSDDAGDSWRQATTDSRPTGRIGGGDLAVPKVDPKNPDILYSTSTVTWRSADGGKTWTGLRGAPGGDDYQNIWINPNNPDLILLVSDQGAIVTVNGGNTWSSWYNQPTAQLYHVITDDQFPYRVYGGQQESGSVGTSSRGNDGEITFREWHPVGVIEYGYVAPDPLHPDIVYGAGRTEVSRFDWTTGQVQNVTPIPVRSDKYRADRTEPVMFSPVDPHILYYATNVLFKTTNGGESWQAISPDLTRPQPGIPSSLGDLAAHDPNAAKMRGAIYALGPSFKDVNTLWAGTDDGLIWATHDGGGNWTNITPPDLIPWSKVTQIVASRFDEQTAYASVSRFRIDDLNPYIYRTRDGGKTWQKITNGLPDAGPVDTVREDRVRKGLLFAGTENAVWVSFDDGDHWQSLQLNLPHTSMRDLWIHDHDLIVATHGRSFWILDDISPLRQITDAVANSDAYLFKLERVYRVRRDTNTDTPLPPDEPAGKNPPDGAIVDYWLKAPAQAPVTLEILDSAGHVVRRFSSADKPEPIDPSLSIPVYWLRPPQVLSASAGMHRFVWDLHYTAPDTLRHEYPIAAVPHDTPREPLGPLAWGNYQVRLTVDGRTFSQELLLKPDPRVQLPATSQGPLDEQLALAVHLTELINRDYLAVSEVRDLQAKIQELQKRNQGSPAAASLTAPLAEIDRKAGELEGRRGSPSGPARSGPESLSQLNDQLSGLYGAVEAADARPTTQQMEAARGLEKALETQLAEWNQIKQQDLPS